MLNENLCDPKLTEDDGVSGGLARLLPSPRHRHRIAANVHRSKVVEVRYLQSDKRCDCEKHSRKPFTSWTFACTELNQLYIQADRPTNAAIASSSRSEASKMLYSYVSVCDARASPHPKTIGW
ncbi:hypothetical protein EVAR_56502_1 [Eumeta japonica]|uniref:Uncharacterized protein n=1 Tax=Eumeta variegata TaxID=151549 RepID=A0A4C1XHG5_EUMVA|nr:hypothetical protein EVAR_56502_1 [Eumeta japonica]